MKKIIYIFLAIVIYKLLKNLIRWFECKMLKRSFILFCHGKDINLYTSKHKFDVLLTEADVQDAYFPTSAPIPGGKYAAYQASIFEAFPTSDPHIASLILKKLEQAIGTYLDRVKECISPIYWIDLILFLPRNILNYLKIDKDKIYYRIINICLSAIWWIFLAAASVFNIGIEIHFGNFTFNIKEIFSDFPNIFWYRTHWCH